ncbi:hypothetical protein PLA107_033880 (plasmid) [Pseudomonas amygdali pv. lachrymans str. M301315]|uniref:Uncharacterized protein n=2 Tax=Pseudomonas amygdali pv. lachrymans TaxID=53707 RepID=A0AAD0PWR6_PSEAV|nr:hypothetical protein PLA107_033880 [Pseudomonas amygdali pv. lachrymans str. M301315]
MRSMITDLSDLIDQLDVPGSPLRLELDESMRAPLRAALLLGLKQSLQHPSCLAAFKAHVELSKLEVTPNNGEAYRRRLASFDYQDHQPVSIERVLIDDAVGWLEYISHSDNSRQLQLSAMVEKAVAEQQSLEFLSLPLSLIHEIADWVQGIMRNDTNALGRNIRKSVKRSTGILISQPRIPGPFGHEHEDGDDEE